LTGSVIETKPTFNPMIGPSPYVQIYMGARYDPCMKNVEGIQNANTTIFWPCPNATSTTDQSCSLSESCGFGGVPNPHVGGSTDDNPAPNQWYRFIIPIFLHGGFVHIGFNLLVQMTMGADMERMIGIWRYTLTYFASGIFGFVLGGNYASQLDPSDGCSGALFGILALYLLDLLYDWTQRESPWVELIIMILGVAVSFVLGLLPGLDNFSHIGGFIMGLAIGLTIMRSPNVLRERIGLARQPYVAMSGGAGQATPDNRKTTSFMDMFKSKRGMSNSSQDIENSKNPINFFKGRKPLWWLWWVVRAGALVAVLIGFIMLLVDFYKYPTSNCSWCYRLSCLPVNGWCKQNTLTFTNTNST
jgi:membrane associated rhomboid family serine protease